MKKTKEYYVCDRCKEEIPKDKINIAPDMMYCYELCDRCFEIYHKYRNQIKLLDNKYDRIAKNFKFGKYLPKNLESEVN